MACVMTASSPGDSAHRKSHRVRSHRGGWDQHRLSDAARRRCADRLILGTFVGVEPSTTTFLLGVAIHLVKGCAVERSTAFL